MEVAVETVPHCITSVVLEEHFLDDCDKLHFSFFNSKTNWILYTIMYTVFPLACFSAFSILIPQLSRPNAIIFINGNWML